MKKLFTGSIAGLFGLLLFAYPVIAAAPDWSVKGTFGINFTCTSGCSGVYPHTMTVSAMNLTNGAFSGTGYYNTNMGYTWNVTGTVNGSNISFQIVYTGLNPGYTVNASGTIANGDLSGTATGLGQAFTWASVSGKADLQPSGVITSPFENEEVSGNVSLAANYTDDNPAGVQWAVREGTCTAATNTRFGNVDGFSTPFTWNGSSFAATVDASSLTPGNYCFVFNPTESTNERDVRLTSWFKVVVPDSDGDGIIDSVDNCPTVSNSDQADMDGDGVGDVCDSDKDGDGILDTNDCEPLDASMWNQVSLYADQDGDGVTTGEGVSFCIGNNLPEGYVRDQNGNDNCPVKVNQDQADLDGDGIGDACDSDKDGDGVENTPDNCPLVANPDQENNDGDNFGDVCDTDDDNDGVLDNADNCQFVENTDQANLDGDALGDACDTDIDGDGVLNEVDCNPNNASIVVIEDSKACQLYNSGVEGKGILNAPGLEKPFNDKSQAGEHAGKK